MVFCIQLLTHVSVCLRVSFNLYFCKMISWVLRRPQYPIMSLKAKRDSLIQSKITRSFRETNSDVWGRFITIPVWNSHVFEEGFSFLTGLPCSSNAFLGPGITQPVLEGSHPGWKLTWGKEIPEQGLLRPMCFKTILQLICCLTWASYLHLYWAPESL